MEKAGRGGKGTGGQRVGEATPRTEKRRQEIMRVSEGWGEEEGGGGLPSEMGEGGTRGMKLNGGFA